jgi:Na+/proline symporter
VGCFAASALLAWLVWHGLTPTLSIEPGPMEALTGRAPPPRGESFYAFLSVIIILATAFMLLGVRFAVGEPTKPTPRSGRFGGYLLAIVGALISALSILGLIGVLPKEPDIPVLSMFLVLGLVLVVRGVRLVARLRSPNPEFQPPPSADPEGAGR